MEWVGSGTWITMTTEATDDITLTAWSTAGEVIACHECGTVHHLPTMPDDTIARCVACGAKILVHFERSVERTLAFYLAALALVVVANAFPILSMSMGGQANASTILDSAKALYDDGMWPLALAVGLAGIFLPVAKILGMLAILVPLQLGLRPPWTVVGFRWVELLQAWAMMEVYLLGVIVAFVKLQDLATVHLGVAFYAFVGTIILMAAADARFEPHAIWRRLAPQATAEVLIPVPGTRLLGCERCDQVVRADEADLHGLECPRCAAPLHHRKPDSLNRSWALALAAAILYIPANLLPIMTVTSLGKGTPDTIVSGVIELLHAGMWPIALLVFVASITVPVLKLVGLVYLLISVHRRSTWRLRDRTLLYRIVEGVGRWSMVDVFMIGILAALVALGNLATIAPGPGAIAFCAVVIITILAAMAFDPRLMWDISDEHNDHSCPARV
jgi:paraquat-inducible protein A